MKLPLDDSDILAFLGSHPDYGDLRFERVKQDRRLYYRFKGTLTDAKHARETIAYWRSKGWEVTEQP